MEFAVFYIITEKIIMKLCSCFKIRNQEAQVNQAPLQKPGEGKLQGRSTKVLDEKQAIHLDISRLREEKEPKPISFLQIVLHENTTTVNSDRIDENNNDPENSPWDLEGRTPMLGKKMLSENSSNDGEDKKPKNLDYKTILYTSQVDFMGDQTASFG